MLGPRRYSKAVRFSSSNMQSGAKFAWFSSVKSTVDMPNFHLFFYKCTSSSDNMDKGQYNKQDCLRKVVGKECQFDTLATKIRVSVHLVVLSSYFAVKFLSLLSSYYMYK